MGQPAELDTVLLRLLRLAQEERVLLEAVDVEGLEALHAERAGLLLRLGEHRGAPATGSLVERVREACAANETIARRQASAIRAQLAHIGSGRRAINAYAPGGGGDAARSVAWLDREG